MQKIAIASLAAVAHAEQPQTSALKYNADDFGVFTLMSNATQFWCIDLDKASGRQDGDIDRTEYLLDKFLGVSDLKTMLTDLLGIDISVYEQQVCDATAGIICIDFIGTLQFDGLYNWRPLTDPIMCPILDLVAQYGNYDIAVDAQYRRKFSDIKGTWPFSIFLS